MHLGLDGGQLFSKLAATRLLDATKKIFRSRALARLPRGLELPAEPLDFHKLGNRQRDFRAIRVLVHGDSTSRATSFVPERLGRVHYSLRGCGT